MIRKSNSDRRIPAKQPAVSAPPATLLSSLIDLSRNICNHRSKFIGSNKQNAANAIRRIKILQAFFEEIQYSKSKDLPDPVVVVLSELNSILLKILHLLHDCALDGARLFMLMKSDLIANRFRVLTRSVASALDDLRFESIDVPIEVVEHVELMMKQLRRAKFDVDREDVEIRKEVESVLTSFDFGIIPENAQIRRVLDYIGIRKWSSCDKEVKFLDSEIEIQWSSRDRVELSFLNDLASFMKYSRCVLFDVVDYDTMHVESEIEMPISLSPDEFLCPISLDFMVDPVMVGSGQTYDRSSIQKWLMAGNSTCPNTRERLLNTDLVPSFALRRIIQQYCSENLIPLEEPNEQNSNKTETLVAGSLIAKEILRELARFLGRLLQSGTPDEKNKAANEIKLLSQASSFTRFCLVEIGLIPNLLKLLSSSNDLTQKNAIAAVLNLSKHSKCKTVIAENNGLERIVNVLRTGDRIEARQIAAMALFFMSSIEDYRKLIGEIPEAVLGLVNLLRDDEDRSRRNAMVAIYGLIIHRKNRLKVLSAGAVPLLVRLVGSSSRERLVMDAMEILKCLANEPEGAAEILQCGGLKSVTEYLDLCSSRTGQNNSISSLLRALAIGEKR